VLNEDLMEEMLDSANLRLAWKAVKSNKGAPGIDHVKVDDFIEQITPHWDNLKQKISNGKYKPSPVKRVYISKGNGKQRALGIPTVQDRYLQQAILQVLQKRIDPTFSEHSYGFRPGRSAHDAVKSAQEFVLSGKDWVVDIDLKSFFDEINQDILMVKVGKHISDKRILHLIGKYLRSGVLENGKVTRSHKGVPQGGPLSPMLANIYLDALDKELESRNLSFCRYADDCNIYVSSQRAAGRVFESVSKWIEKNLKIPINTEKSDSGRPWERQFLGYQITEKGELKPSDKSLKKYKDRVRKHFSGLVSATSKELRDTWLSFVRGWCNYFRLADDKYWRKGLSGWTRRHIRKCFWIRWHGAKGRRRNLAKLGLTARDIKRCNVTGAPWVMATHPAVQTALKNKVLKKYGFLVPLDFAEQ